jgi:FkbM family methyltransferase
MAEKKHNLHPLVKYRLKQLLSVVGFRARAGCKPRSNLGGFCRLLRKLGFAPGTVVDVGVADGTFELYEAFPDSFHLLVEPMKEFEPVMRYICKRYNAEYVLAAAGEKSEEAEIYFSDDKHGSSLLKQNGASRKIASMKLDDVMARRQYAPPFMLKVDVQGFEHSVIEGADSILKNTEVVVLETGLFRFKKDRPLVHETIAFMLARGFVPFDFFGGHGRPLDGSLAQIDVAFVKEGGRFKQSHAYH